MYAYIHIAQRGSFEGVYAPTSTTAHLHYPTPLPHTSRIAWDGAVLSEVVARADPHAR
jgi:hypothetical protein